VFGRQNRRLRLWLGGSDLLLTWLALEAAYATRSHLEFERLFYLETPVKLLLLFFSMAAWVLVALWSRLYDLTLTGAPGRIAFGALRQIFLAGTAVVLFGFALRLDLSRPFLGLFFAYSFVFMVAFRLLVRTVAPRVIRGWAARRYLLIAGANERGRRLARQVEGVSGYGLELLGFLDDEAGEVELGRVYPVHAWGELPRLLETQVVDEILFAVDSQRLARLEDVFLLCDEEGVRVRVDVAFFPHVHRRVTLDRLAEDTPLLTFAAAPHDELRLVAKRATDLVLSAVALVVLAPVLLLIAVLIRATSAGPALYAQTRCGLNGRRFKLYKFRTMVANAEELKAQIAHLNVKKTAFKVPNDPRVTGVGRILRRFSLDELPQLWNVVRGEMALVGPRPPVPSEVTEYERWQRRRLRMRPGLTCLWALAGRDALDFDEWMRLDLAYIDAWSLKLDWSIMLRTIPRVLTGKGAH
jgi:exopolysaccharide biosynthesis polyprenyl glycosylphosphotransferase